MKNENIVCYSSKTLPKPSQEVVDRFLSIRDEDIDRSDIPELTDEFWKNAKPVMPNKKKTVSMKMDQNLYD